MSFYLPKFIWFVINPMAILLTLLCLSVLLHLSRRGRAFGRRLMLACVSVIILLSVLPVGQFMTAALESRFPPVHRLPDKVDGIIVLGGSFHAILSQARGQPVLNNNAERLTAFAGLAHRYPQAKLVFTGGIGTTREDVYLRESDIAAQIFDQMGLDKSRIILEGEARNTHEHPAMIRKLVTPRPEETWILITSAYHMSRAVGVFRAQNWPVLAYPTDYRTAGVRNSWYPGFDLAGGLENFTFATHNWAALVLYYFLGRTSEFLPKAGS